MKNYKVFLDSNILIHLTVSDIDENKTKKTLQKLDDLSDEGYDFYISTQVIREFFAVVTGSKYLRNPLTSKKANEQIKDFRDKLKVKIIDDKTLDILGEIVEKYEIKGQKIHDTTIAAVMIRYGILKVMTYNDKDFGIYEEIEVIELD